MGARLVSLALARWTHVSDRAFRLLVRMALTALDEPSPGAPACVYFGGRDLLAMTLRNEGGNPQTRYRAVKRLLAELVEAGAIERAQPGRAGQNAVYRLTLDGVRAIDILPSTPATQGGPVSPPEGGLSAPARGATEAPPRNQEEPQEELSEEEEINLRTAVTGSRAREHAEEPDSSEEVAEPSPAGCRRHGRAFSPGTRPDGKPACPLCRRGAPASVPGIAPVIPITHLRQETA